MESFLKNRPTIDPKSALVLAAEPLPKAAPVKPPTEGEGPAPFGQIRRDPASQTSGTPKGDAPAGTGPAGGSAVGARGGHPVPQSLTGEHGTKVQTILENGRVSRIIVTCACGKVTEISCQY